jgi:hypothetical protein
MHMAVSVRVPLPNSSAATGSADIPSPAPPAVVPVAASRQSTTLISLGRLPPTREAAFSLLAQLKLKLVHTRHAKSRAPRLRDALDGIPPRGTWYAFTPTQRVSERARLQRLSNPPHEANQNEQHDGADCRGKNLRHDISAGIEPESRQ